MVGGKFVIINAMQCFIDNSCLFTNTTPTRHDGSRYLFFRKNNSRNQQLKDGTVMKKT